MDTTTPNERDALEALSHRASALSGTLARAARLTGNLDPKWMERARALVSEAADEAREIGAACEAFEIPANVHEGGQGNEPG